MGIPEQLEHHRVFKEAYDQAKEKADGADLDALRKMIAEDRGSIVAVLNCMVELDKKFNAILEGYMSLGQMFKKHLENENRVAMANPSYW